MMMILLMMILLLVLKIGDGDIISSVGIGGGGGGLYLARLFDFSVNCCVNRWGCGVWWLGLVWRWILFLAILMDNDQSSWLKLVKGCATSGIAMRYYSIIESSPTPTLSITRYVPIRWASHARWSHHRVVVVVGWRVEGGEGRGVRETRELRLISRVGRLFRRHYLCEDGVICVFVISDLELLLVMILFWRAWENLSHFLIPNIEWLMVIPSFQGLMERALF